MADCTNSVRAIYSYIRCYAGPAQRLSRVAQRTAIMCNMCTARPRIRRMLANTARGCLERVDAVPYDRRR